jgi:hypothetical protein
MDLTVEEANAVLDARINKQNGKDKLIPFFDAMAMLFGQAGETKIDVPDLFQDLETAEPNPEADDDYFNNIANRILAIDACASPLGLDSECPDVL